MLGVSEHIRIIFVTINVKSGVKFSLYLLTLIRIEISFTQFPHLNRYIRLPINNKLMETKNVICITKVIHQ